VLKTVKLKSEVYDALERLRRDKESFSECVDRLIKAYEQMISIAGQPSKRGG